MSKVLRRQDIIFDDKDRALSHDVNMLGALIGELIREQGGDELFEFVENVRLRSIRRREGNEKPSEKLATLLKNIDLTLVTEIIRSFSTYFQMANIAEKVHRIRRRREYLQKTGQYQPGSLEETFVKLKAASFDLDALQKLLNQINIEPVFTAHPTEPTRRTILRKEQNIVRRLIDMLNPTMTRQETHVCLENIKLEVTTGWQTDEHPSEQMTVADELEHVLFFITDVLYPAIPPFYEDIENAVVRVYGEKVQHLHIPDLISFASWVGGDMDGNPNVNGKTIRATMARQRSLILDRYYKECGKLSVKLSQSHNRITVDELITKKINEYSHIFPNAYHDVPSRHRDMPYRIFLRLIQQRLQATYDDDVYPYEGVNQFETDICLIEKSLIANKGSHAGLFAVRRLLRRIRTFGFHLVKLDIRQDALVHRKVVGECLGEADWLDWSTEERCNRIELALNNKESPVSTQEVQTRKTFAIFQAIAFCRRKYGKHAIGPFIISMTQGADDILTVLLLAYWGGLHNPQEEVPLDITPLLETVDDLKKGPEILESLLTNNIYREHLKFRNDRQIVMIGYSDSNKDSGLASARWALQNAQVTLATTVSKKNIELILFHGRGGSISRGGSKTHASVLGAPPGTINGNLRVTEQGEIINEKYGLRGIALRTLEQVTGSVALATAIPQHRGSDMPEWHTMMDIIAYESRRAYRNLIYDNPRFYEYFRKATPIDLIERMRIGSRPSTRRGNQNIDNLRAIPWVFAWTQSRCVLPGWYGFGTGLQAAVKDIDTIALTDMFHEWYFMRALTADAEMVLAKVDLNIARLYSELAGDLHDEFFPIIEKEFELTRNLILEFSGHNSLLDGDTTLQRAIMLRNPYVDPMSFMQVDLLARWRASNYEDEELFSVLLTSVNGIAQGLQNTG